MDFGDAKTFLIICCDGVWDVKSNQEVVDFIRTRLPGRPDERALERVLEDLLDACVSPDLRMTNGLGGDNMTAVLVLLRSMEEPDEAGELDRRSFAVFNYLQKDQDNAGWSQRRWKTPKVGCRCICKYQAAFR
eukprot:g4336.t1